MNERVNAVHARLNCSLTVPLGSIPIESGEHGQNCGGGGAPRNRCYLWETELSTPEMGKEGGRRGRGEERRFVFFVDLESALDWKVQNMFAYPSLSDKGKGFFKNQFKNSKIQCTHNSSYWARVWDRVGGMNRGGKGGEGSRLTTVTSFLKGQLQCIPVRQPACPRRATLLSLPRLCFRRVRSVGKGYKIWHEQGSIGLS